MKRKIKFRPLWSFQLEKTEKWLRKMNEKGYEIYSILPFISLFLFHPSTSNQIPKTYRILYKTSTLPNAMTTIGWTLKQVTSNWFIASVDTDSPMYFPSEEKSLKRLTRYYLFYSTAFIIYLIIFSNIIAIKDFSYKTGLLLISINFILLFLFIICFYFYQRLERRTFNIIVEKPENEDDLKFKIGWFNHPIKTEKWLNEIDSQGYKIIKVTGLIFYLKKKVNTSIKTVYKVTVNFRVKKSYFSIYQEAGWRVKYTAGAIINTTIWAKEYEGDIIPEFYDSIREEVKVINRQIQLFIVRTLSFIIPLFLVFTMFDYWETNRLLSTWEVYISVLPASLLVVFVMGKAIINLWKYKRSIETGNEYKPVKKWVTSLVAIVFLGAVIMSNSLYRYITPYEFKSQLEIFNVRVVINEKEKIELPGEKVYTIVENISLRNPKVGQKDEEKQYIQLFFEESGKNYLFHGGGNSPYYLAYWSNNTYRQYRVENGKQLHEELLEIINQ